MIQFNTLKTNQFIATAFLLLSLLFVSSQVSATTVLQMNLATMVERAGKVFSGKVISVTEGKIEAGGGSLPVLHYRVRVNDAFKGEFIEEKGVKFAEFTTLGTLAQAKSNDLNLFTYLREGDEYLLLVGADGPVGITATVGLAQGAFELFEDTDKNKMALNGANNVGLFRGMAGIEPTVAKSPSRLPSSSADSAKRKGAVSYAFLADLIRAQLEGRR